MSDQHHQVALVLMHRDLRLQDNSAINLAATRADKVAVGFIFTKTQLTDANKYKSSNAIQFMMDSLKEVDADLRKKKSGLWCSYGEELSCLKKLLSATDATLLVFHDDYTKYSASRDQKFWDYCEKSGIECQIVTDCLLVGDAEINTKSGEPHKIYSNFLKEAKKIEVPKPTSKRASFLKHNGEAKMKFSHWHDYFRNQEIYQENRDLTVKGGRKGGLAAIRKTDFAKYGKQTDHIDQDYTSMLSAHNHFGTVSIREVYHAAEADKSHKFRDNLYWRDFHYHLAINFDEFWKYDHIFHPNPTESAKIWVSGAESGKRFRAWRDSKTGFPIVDAAMCELRETGWMHNRCRLIVAEFLCKTLRVHWKKGEQEFARWLVDYDRCQNMGNWNWASSSGLDHTQFLRVFNPWKQSKDYDPDGEYIKSWLPELEDVEPVHLHHWDKHHHKYEIDYPEPIVDHGEEAPLFKEAWYRAYRD